MALKDISRDCTDSMKPYAEAVIASIQQSLQAGQLNQGECVRLMYPLGKMLSLLPPAQILPRHSPILSDHLPALGQLSKTLPTPDSRPRLLLVLKLLTMLFTTQDIARREETQPTFPTTIVQAAPPFKLQQSLFETDHNGVGGSGRTSLSKQFVTSRPYLGAGQQGPIPVILTSTLTCYRLG